MRRKKRRFEAKLSLSKEDVVIAKTNDPNAILKNLSPSVPLIDFVRFFQSCSTVSVVELPLNFRDVLRVITELAKTVY